MFGLYERSVGTSSFGAIFGPALWMFLLSARDRSGVKWRGSGTCAFVFVLFVRLFSPVQEQWFTHPPTSALDPKF